MSYLTQQFDDSPRLSAGPTSRLLCTRRSALRAGGAGVLGLGGLGLLDYAALFAQETNEKTLAPLNRDPRMMQNFLVAQVREAEKHHVAAIDALQTKQDAEKYVEQTRVKIRTAFGPFPEKTPLNAKITGKVERDVYDIEKVIFESRPDLLVTANLYVPKGRKFPLPGVVGACGHTTNGKAHDEYQSFAQGLARLGYVVLIYDPIGQGERLQYPNDDLKSRVGPGVSEHLMAGNQQFLVGEFFGAWRAWDGIRALDYLLTREEVDAKHIGLTGNSGGGTMTTWLCGLDPRWTMAAPNCFVTTFRRNAENELPADTEQCPPGTLALGLDHDSFLAAMAPKPVIIQAEERDFFDVRGSQEAYQRLKKIYRLLGSEENIGIHVGPNYHSIGQESRESIYSWFHRATGGEGQLKEPKLTIEKDETLQCTPKGQVAALGSRSLFSFTKEKAERWSRRQPREGDALRDAVSRLLGRPLEKGSRRTADHVTAKKTVIEPPAVTRPPEFRILRNRRTNRRYPLRYATTYLVETEPGVHAWVYRLSGEYSLVSRPPSGAPRAMLYISHNSADAELRDEPLVKEIIEQEKDAAIFTCDVRGVGESQPDTCGENSYRHAYGSDYFYAIHGVMLNRPMVTQRVWDVLRVLEWLGSFGHEQVHLVANGWGTIPATLAAILSDQVVQVTLKSPLASYGELAQTEIYDWPLSSLAPDVLHEFDLPECYRELEKRKKLRTVTT